MLSMQMVQRRGVKQPKTIRAPDGAQHQKRTKTLKKLTMNRKDILLDIQDNPHKPTRPVSADNDVSLNCSELSKYEVCKLRSETGNVGPDLATQRRRDLKGRLLKN
ncbi:hypothetical protein NQ318_017477 [Aromia moschata]|uniref:Uncharacterized protein n=1 Tax=Aromia moschata TaxID=1265417 RepID=A0AAV8Z2D8_9CUCU|nr:hypothetical protein NQ318_017477 [Aromia moschata]